MAIVRRMRAALRPWQRGPGAARRVGLPATPLGGEPSSAWPPWAFDLLPAVTIVVPVHNAFDALQRCVAALLRNTSYPAELLFIDDGSTDERVAPYLDGLVGPGIRVLHNAENLGFVRTVNRALAETDKDVVLLNADVEVVPGWLQRMVAAAAFDQRIATVTPLSNNAGAFSAPNLGEQCETPLWVDRDGTGRLVAHGAGRFYPSTPTANGYCMYLRRAALDDVGGFDAEAFPRGYGEENDFSMRALEAGWRHVVDDSTYVFHERSASFGDEKHELMAKARIVVDERYPDYGPLVRQFVNSSEMVAARRRTGHLFDEPSHVLPRVLVILHGGGGGMVLTTQDLALALADRVETWYLRSDGRTAWLTRTPDGSEVIDSWRYADPLSSVEVTSGAYTAIVAHILTRYAIELVHVRHLIGHTTDLPRVASRLGIPVVLSLHDYYYVCPTVHLLDDQDRFCGGVCTSGQGRCRLPTAWVADHMPHLKHSGVHVWRKHVSTMLQHVDVLVAAAPSVRDLYVATFPGLSDRPFHVVEHGRDFGDGEIDVGSLPLDDEKVRILVAGRLEVHKGRHVIEALVREDRGQRLEFHFIGETSAATRDLGVVHGTYSRDEYADLARQIRPAFAGIFSITAETFSHTLTEAWSVGIPVIASDLGALRDRITAQGGGWLVDPHDPEGMYRRILAIADDPAAYAQACAEIKAHRLRTTRDMADDYEAIYRTAMARRRSFSLGNRVVRQPMRLGVLARGDGVRFAASAHVRALRRYWHPGLAHLVAPQVMEADCTPAMARQFDAVLVERNAIPADLTGAFLDVVHQAAIPLVLDLDDDLIEIPDSHPHAASYGRDVGDSLARLAREAAVVTVSTALLAERFEHLNDRVVVLRNMLDERLWLTDLGLAPVSPAPPQRLRILYFGDSSHVRDLELIRDAVAGNDAVALTLVGVATSANAPEWASVIDVPPEKRQYPEFVRWLRRRALDFDVAVAPLLDDEWSQYKSDLKFLEATALGLPVLASDTAPYRTTIIHGETGMLVGSDPQHWADALDEVGRDSPLRERLAHHAYTYVTTNRLMRHQVDDVGQLLATLSTR